MNLPNKLSIARAVCIPVIVILLYLKDPACRITAGILFILACLTRDRFRQVYRSGG